MTDIYQDSTERECHTNELDNEENTQDDFPCTPSDKITAIVNRVSTEKKTTDEILKDWRQQLTKIAKTIRKTTSIDTLLQIVSSEIREVLEVDRVFIYQFSAEESGIILAESIAQGWTPTKGEILPVVTFGLETKNLYLDAVTIDDVEEVELTPYQLQLLEKYQVKSSLILPIFLENDVWGLLGVHNCSTACQWKEFQISLLERVTVEVTQKLRDLEVEEKLADQAKKQRSLNKIIDKLQRPYKIEQIFKIATQEVRQLLKCERVAVYHFERECNGEFIAESIAAGYSPFVGDEIHNFWEDTTLQETQGDRYRERETFAVNDIYQAGHSESHLEILEQFEVKAYAVAPIFVGQRLWGLVTAYQNTAPRAWKSWEVNFLKQVAINFGIAVSQAEYMELIQAQSDRLTQTTERQQHVSYLIRKIGQTLTEKFTDSSQFEIILQTTVAEVRRLLQADHTVIYRFNSDRSGDFIAESLDRGWTSFKEKLTEKQIDPDLLQENAHCESIRSLENIYKTDIERSAYKNEETYLQDPQAIKSQQNKAFVINDISQAQFPRCYKDLLEQFEAKAYLIVPIFQNNQLWGLLATYQHSDIRIWEDYEISAMGQIAVLLGIALQQAEYVRELQVRSRKIQQAAEQKQLVSNIVERIRQSTGDLENLFNSTAKEIRSLLSADRVGVFRFCVENGNYDEGEFIAEDVLKPYKSVLKGKVQDRCFSEQYHSDYREGKIQAIPDIYNAGFSECHIEILAKLEIRANLIVPLIKGDDLWGFLCIHQCSEPRNWEEQEIDLIKQISGQFGVVLQQAEYLEKLQLQSQQLTAAAANDKQAKEEFQKRAIELLGAVRPALDGDLTVRAPIAEDELGTIADAYNNTLQALRQIVLQVQTAAQQVAENSQRSNGALTGLTTLAQQQSHEVNEALNEIQQTVDSTQAVVANAESVQVVVTRTNATVNLGDTAMNRTVEAMETIRETVAQTSKKIKRLSESSQKISKVVNLISNFATQTNVLALNAAIEATRAGEYGKGFAVVADEVRSLSRQSAAATIEIEKLVQEIQEETGDVAVAMEDGIQQVVEGTTLVSETRQNLNEIVAATSEISSLLQEITDATQTQMLQSVSATASMKDVAQIANKTAVEANGIATVFQQLSEMAQELLMSASKFKVD
ncbi:MAG: GAF domain-containing protein [Mastigocoleus sp. MO_167.B18]|nr:GAF domain-containing protein [Mastigocoleus sp. MO_167.B18]